MRTMDVKCPICGTVNHNLYLDETGGWMECECCGSVTCSKQVGGTVKIPVYSGRFLRDCLSDSGADIRPALQLG